MMSGSVGSESSAVLLDEKSILSLVKNFVHGSGWREGYEIFVRQNCHLFANFNPKTFTNLNESGSDFSTDDVNVLELWRTFVLFQEVFDDAFSSRLEDEFPQLSLESVAVALQRRDPDDAVLTEINESFLVYNDFATFGQFMSKRYQKLKDTKIHVFQDGENCYFGNSASLRVDELILLAEEEIRREASLPGNCPVHWRLFLGPLTQANAAFYPSPKNVETLGTIGVDHLRVPCIKQDDVDTKLKDSITRFTREFRRIADEQFVVIVSGDSDFTGNLKELRAEGFRTMLLHGSKHLKKGMKMHADVASNQWFHLVHKAGGPPPPETHATNQQHILEIPKGAAGYLIGPGGQTIQTMQESSGATINVDAKGEVCRVKVKGTNAAVEAAVSLINEHMLAFAHRTTQVLTFESEEGLAGKIVGKGGQNVKKVQADTKAKVRVDDKDGKVLVTIKGTEQQITEAKAMIESHVATL